MNKFFRHGDLLIEKVSGNPKGNKKDNNILLEGEASGHIHVLSRGSVYAINPTKENNYLMGYFEVEENAQITHQEHAPIELEKGIYKFYRQREYDEIEDRMVID